MSYVQLDLPERLVASHSNIAKENRSKSQPSLSPIQIDCDHRYDNANIPITRINDVGYYNMFAESEGSSSKERSYRSSVHSTTSSITSSSTLSSNDDPCLLTVEAAWDHVAILPDELPFAAGDTINVLDHTSHSDMWYGRCRDRNGWFPSSHVRVLNRSLINRIANPTDFPPQMRHLRASIIQELMSTERDYTNLLQNLVQGFVDQTRRRVDLFSPLRVQKVFGNIEAICSLHCKFLRDLEIAYNPVVPEESCIGTTFLRNKSKFSIYSEYCNNRPISCAELDKLNEQQQYHQFFEACRLLREMPKLPLEGFLLTPVQRICRYPLQLAELLKATPVSHADFEPVQAAATAMRSVAAQINEKKRRLENLQKIALWQQNVSGWRGPDLVETNCRMIHSGEVSCRCVEGSGIVWHKDVHLFLFDQLLVICKKDLIKRNHFLFRESIPLASVSFADVPDGKDPILGVSMKNAWKLISVGRELIFSCKDQTSKNEWCGYLAKRIELSPPTNDERRLVRDTVKRNSCSWHEPRFFITSKALRRSSKKKHKFLSS
ncbi:hypothetical protein AB6A40_000182 [Gnathostoma spinigerum]|uniref:Rho guanine nucleotide exchange factor n=1 Tax=Gnathostoma spinigerum TaxID=75299 RepID=A0ABD6E1P1_9BILA